MSGAMVFTIKIGPLQMGHNTKDIYLHLPTWKKNVFLWCLWTIQLWLLMFQANTHIFCTRWLSFPSFLCRLCTDMEKNYKMSWKTLSILCRGIGPLTRKFALWRQYGFCFTTLGVGMVASPWCAGTTVDTLKLYDYLAPRGLLTAGKTAVWVIGFQ